MRDTRLYTTAFAAAFASFLGLGSGAAAGLATPPQSYESERIAGETLPIWLVRYKLRQRGYQDIYRVNVEGDGFAVHAHDCWGRHVKLYVDGCSAQVIPRPGFGLAHLCLEDVAPHLASLGYDCLTEPTYRDDHFQALARDTAGVRSIVNIDPLSGAVWLADA
ncbi:MAG TPA: hypothetical protein VEJ16_19000 [Alphaproteobacteria bacterium]|nr:hypothetical protein [Alphaproteobacteria bacterium]